MAALFVLTKHNESEVDVNVSRNVAQKEFV
jgi:hypothetical protein